MSEYWKKLKDPRWQKKRLEVMERDEFTCRTCGSKTETLTVHHVNYGKGREPWDYVAQNFLTLCDSCHSSLEDYSIPAARRAAAAMRTEVAVAVFNRIVAAVENLESQSAEYDELDLLEIASNLCERDLVDVHAPKPVAEYKSPAISGMFDAMRAAIGLPSKA